MQLQFVIQTHSGWGPTHWDLMLQQPQQPGLAAWQLLRCPAEAQQGLTLPAVRLADHREAYLTYEGPVSGGRGRVEIFDAGALQILAAGPADWRFRLAGRHLRGAFALQPSGDAWLLRREDDLEETVS